MNYLQPELLDRLAREHALGTLTGGARRRFEHLVRTAPQAAQALARWQQRLDVLAQAAPGIAPRPQVWDGLQARLFKGPAGAAPAGAKGGVLVGWRAGGWAGLGVLAGALLCTVVLRVQPALWGLEPASERFPASYVGVLDDARGQALVVTSARRHGKALTVRVLRPVALPAGSVLQLWAWSEAAPAPVPVVAWTQVGTTTLALGGEAEAALGAMTHLGVSIEARPRQGEPGATPATPYLAQGHCAKLW